MTKTGLKKKIAAIDEKINKLAMEREDLSEQLKEKNKKGSGWFFSTLFFLAFAAAAFWIVITISGFTFSDAAELARLEFNKMMGE